MPQYFGITGTLFTFISRLATNEAYWLFCNSKKELPINKSDPLYLITLTQNYNLINEDVSHFFDMKGISSNQAKKQAINKMPIFDPIKI